MSTTQILLIAAGLTLSLALIWFAFAGPSPAKEGARRKIVAAAKRHGIEVSEDSNVASPSKSLRAASTRRGPRGGRKKPD